MFTRDSGMFGCAVAAEGADPRLRGPPANLLGDRRGADQKLAQTSEK
jgi:hypothetical protein